MLNEAFYRKGIIAAGLVNVIGILLISKAFTNDVLTQADPIVFSKFGCLMIMVWGLAYISMANNFQKAPMILLVFALEKVAYTGAWLVWIVTSPAEISALIGQDFMVGLFYATYGLNDLAFAVLFYMAYRFAQQQNALVVA